MNGKAAFYRGCFLAMAAGDAMGYTVDEMTWEQISEEFGENGLLGYDLRNENAQVTSYTQICAYTANGLLLALTRGRRSYLPAVTRALREWYKRQHFPRDPEKSLCWISQIPELRRRRCRDARMMDALRMPELGTLTKPINSANSPGALLAGAAIGLFYNERWMDPPQIGTLAMDCAALTHGDPEAGLATAVLAYTIAGIMQEPEQPLHEQFLQATEAVDLQFRKQYPQASQLAAQLKVAIRLARSRRTPRLEDMEQLKCHTAGECLAGAMYACLLHPDDPDGALITAVNHSGKSAAVGAVTGAILGACLSDAALPRFYLESLEAAEALRTLADDLAIGNPAAGLFDDDWDHKYVHGQSLI